MATEQLTETCADRLVDALHANGVTVIFGLPGVQLDAAFDALARRRDTIDVFALRNEQATSYMAEGYARVTGRAGCCLVVPGPGLLNASAGLASAYALNTPVVCIAGQIDSHGIERGLGQLHEIPHQLEMLASVTKWAGRIDSPEDTEAMVSEAFRRLAEGRPRPVALEVPVDVLEATATGRPAGAPPTPAPTAPDLSGLDAAADLLQKAERPLLVAGGGVLQSGAWDELRLLAERLQAPVLLTVNARGALPSDHPLAFNVVSAPSLIGSADVILAVGTRFAASRGERFTLAPAQHLVRIDVDPEELTRDVDPEVAIVSDARRPLSLLGESVPERQASGWRGLDELRAGAQARIDGVQPQAAFGAAVRAAVTDDTVIVGGMTQVGYWSQIGMPVSRPRTYLGAGYQGALGFEVPTGLGAQVGRPDNRVVVLSGDGGFMFNVQELATAAQYRIPAIFVIFNDGAYGNVRRTQRQRFGRVIASELKNPDFVKLSESFEIPAFRAEGPEALTRALRKAMDTEGPALIDVPVGEMPAVWPLLRG